MRVAHGTVGFGRRVPAEVGGVSGGIRGVHPRYRLAVHEVVRNAVVVVGLLIHRSAEIEVNVVRADRGHERRKELSAACAGNEIDRSALKR